MNWEPIDEGGDERTEVMEVPKRGCLARVVAKSGDGWKTVSLTWCPGLRAKDFGLEPEPAAAVASEGAPPAAPPAEPPRPAAVTPPQDAAPEELVELLKSYVQMCVAVIGGFRAKVGVASGRIGFCENTPQVGSYPVEGYGSWVWRIDPDMATLKNKERVIAIGLPHHSRDQAFAADLFCEFLKATKRAFVAHRGSVYPADEVNVQHLLDQLVDEGLAVAFRGPPGPRYELK